MPSAVLEFLNARRQPTDIWA